MKKSAVIATALIALISSMGLYAYNQGHFSSGIKQCPQAWYDNQMPGIRLSGSASTEKNTQYLVINGERRETDEFNIQWISSHCEISKPAVVK